MGEGVLEGTAIGDGEPGAGDFRAMEGKWAVASVRSWAIEASVEQAVMEDMVVTLLRLVRMHLLTVVMSGVSKITSRTDGSLSFETPG